MSTRKFSPWSTIASATCAPGKPADDSTIRWGGGWVSGANDEEFASNECWLYAHTRHNILNVPFVGALNLSGDSATFRVTPGAGGVEKLFAVVPIVGRVSYPGTLKVWFYAKTTSELAANTVVLNASIKYPGTAAPLVSASTTVASTTGAWYSVLLELPQMESTSGGSGMGSTTGGEPWLTVGAKIDAGAANYVTIESVCAYQLTRSATPVHLDLDLANNVFGDADIPRSTAISHKMHDELTAIYNSRTVRSNVMSHWFTIPYDGMTGSYPADAGEIGKYKLVKRAGCSAMFTYACVNEVSGGGNTWDLRFTMTTTTEATATVTGITNASASYWVGSKFTFSTAATALEKELTLSLSGKCSVASIALGVVWGVCVTEKPISTTSIVHTIPDPAATGAHGYNYSSYIRSAGQGQTDEVNTLTHLWKRTPAIAMSDWRAALASGYQNQIICSKETADKQDPQAPNYNASCSVIARALVFPSSGCQRLRICLGVQPLLETTNAYIPDDTEVNLMYIWAQISNSTALSTYSWNGPARYENHAGNIVETYMAGTRNDEFEQMSDTGWVMNRHYITSEQMPLFHPSYRMQCYTSPMTAATWLTPTSTITAASLVQPLQVMVMAWTSNSSVDFLCPIYLSIDEVVLAESEFP